MAEVGSLSGSAKHPTKLSENFLRQIDRSSSSSNIYDVGRKLVWVENVWEKIVEKFFFWWRMFWWKILVELFLVEIFKGNAIFDILTQLLKNIAYIGSWKHFVLVFVCVCVS